MKHTGAGVETEMPTHARITSQDQIVGPANVKVKADSLGGRWTSYNFLIVFNVD